MKRDIYDLVLNNKPTGRVRTVGLEDDKLEEVEVVIGVGVISDFGKKGYSGLVAEEVYRDVVFDDGDYDPEMVVCNSLPVLLKHNANSIPIYKYISQVSCELPDNVNSEIKNNYDDLLSRTIKKQREKFTIPEKSIKEMRTKHNDIKCLQYIPLLKCDQINIDELHEFLKKIMVDYPNILANGNSNEKSNLRRLIKIFDWLKYNQKQKSPNHSEDESPA
ncbi:MAG: hypothetical protein WA118_06740 [Carboxydocellales bacterium]